MSRSVLRYIVLFTSASCLMATAEVHGQVIDVDPLGPREHVRDLANLIQPEDVERVNRICEALSSEGVAPVIVMTITSVKSHSETGMPFAVFSVLLFNQLRNGDAVAGRNWNRGMLLLVSRDDRKVGIELGDGWGHVQYVSAREIKDERLLPYFERNQFSQGIVAGIEALDKLARKPGMQEETRSARYGPLVRILKGLGVGIAVFALLFGLLAGRKAWTLFFGEKAMLAAARDGDEAMVEKWIKRGVDVDCSDVNWGTALYHVSRGGHVEIATFLLEHGAHPNTKTFRGDFPLFQAAQVGSVDVVELLLSHGAHVNAGTKSGGSSLIVAARRGNLDVVELLIKNGASIDAQNTHGLTALFAAVDKGWESIVSLLLDSGADVNRTSKEGITPLMRSVLVAKSLGDPEILRLLLAHGVDVNARTPRPERTTALMMAVQVEEIETVKLLLAAGADVDMKYNDEHDSIELAHRKDNLVLADLLKEHGEKGQAKPNIIDAVKQGDLDRVKEILVEKPRHVHIVTAHSRWTPLHLAAMTGNKKMVEFLLARGAKTDATNKSGQTAKEMALRGGYDDICSLLSTSAKGAKSILKAVTSGDLEVVEAILHTEPHVIRIASANSGWTPLHLAVKKGNQPMAKLLLAHGANIEAMNKDGMTPCAVAEESGHAELVALLQARWAEDGKGLGFLDAIRKGELEKVRDMLAGNRDLIHVATANLKWSPLHIAVMDGNEAMVELLLTEGAEVNAANKGGKTAVHHAAGRGNLGVLELLLMHGADITLKYNGRTPLDRAAETGHEKAAELLRNHGTTRSLSRETVS